MIYYKCFKVLVETDVCFFGTVKSGNLSPFSRNFVNASHSILALI